MDGIPSIRNLRYRCTPGYAFCPPFELTVDSAGETVFICQELDPYPYVLRWTITEKDVVALERALSRASFPTLRDEYVEVIALDHDSCAVEVEYSDGATKSVSHYRGDFTAPRALQLLERSIERITGVRKRVASLLDGM